MDLEYISIKTVLEDYIDYSGEQLQIPESIVLKTANDTLQKILTGENLDLRIAKLEIKDYQAILPKGFKSVVQCLYRDFTPHRLRREEVVEWSQNLYNGDGCKLKINLECPNCHQDSCDCNSDVVVVNVDRMWQDSHPEYYASKRYLHNYGKVGDPRHNACYDFKIMRRRQNNFGMIKYHIPNCINLHFDDPNHAEYEISLPKIVTSIKEGEILLSYLSTVLDDEGYFMIPNHSRIMEALFYAIEERMLWKDLRKTGDPKFRELFLIAEKKKNDSIALARAAIQVPSYDQWMEFARNHWTKYIPETIDRNEINLGRHSSDRYKNPQF
jgi:hypothetical protein